MSQTSPLSEPAPSLSPPSPLSELPPLSLSPPQFQLSPLSDLLPLSLSPPQIPLSPLSELPPLSPPQFQLSPLSVSAQELEDNIDISELLSNGEEREGDQYEYRDGIPESLSLTDENESEEMGMVSLNFLNFLQTVDLTQDVPMTGTSGVNLAQDIPMTATSGIVRSESRRKRMLPRVRQLRYIPESALPIPRLPVEIGRLRPGEVYQSKKITISRRNISPTIVTSQMRRESDSEEDERPEPLRRVSRVDADENDSLPRVNKISLVEQPGFVLESAVMRIEPMRHTDHSFAAGADYSPPRASWIPYADDYDAVDIYEKAFGRPEAQTTEGHIVADARGGAAVIKQGRGARRRAARKAVAIRQSATRHAVMEQEMGPLVWLGQNWRLVVVGVLLLLAVGAVWILGQQLFFAAN